MCYGAAGRRECGDAVLQLRDRDREGAGGHGLQRLQPEPARCFSNGRTVEEARRNMRDAIQQHVTALLAHGESVPQNERLAQ